MDISNEHYLAAKLLGQDVLHECRGTAAKKWMICKWCGELQETSSDKSNNYPCKGYPIQRFTITDIMEAYGKKNIMVSLRYNPARENHNFTIIIDSDIRLIRIDTSEPFEDMMRLVREDMEKRNATNIS